MIPHQFIIVSNEIPFVGVNSQGFLSKFFYRSETNVPEPKEDVGSDIANITISDTTPVGVTRVENKQVLINI